MDLDEKIALVQRNTVEVVENDELKKLLETSKKPSAYCGYEPSGEIHLGHLVTVTKLIDLEKAGIKVKVLFADWHAWLNKKGSWDEIKEVVKIWEKGFTKLGLKNPEFVLGTSFQRNDDYIDDLLKLSINTTVNRGLRSMQEVARDINHASVSQLIYPLMQINDIKHLGVDIAQSGIEQRKIHMLAREILEKVEYKKPILVHTPLIASLTSSGKMSSSEPDSIISVRDSSEDIKKKINKANCPEGSVEENPVLDIAKLVVFPRTDSLEIKRDEKYGGSVRYDDFSELEKAFAKKELHPMDLKNAVAENLIKILDPVRKLFQ